MGTSHSAAKYNDDFRVTTDFSILAIVGLPDDSLQALLFQRHILISRSIIGILIIVIRNYHNYDNTIIFYVIFCGRS
jgi:hypothetical protein